MRVSKELDTSYVSFFTRGDPLLSGAKRKYSRATRAFKTEADAKVFAREIVENGWTWAMMMLGFAGIGAMTYRRRNSAAIAA
jgi:hypothetical protein